MILGAHESVKGGLACAFARAHAHQAKSLQIFTKSSRGWGYQPLEEAHRAEFVREQARTRLPAIAHGSYLLNLAAEEGPVREKSIACLLEELTRCEKLEIPCLVIHPGAHPDLKGGIRRIAQALDTVHRATPRFRSRICLEGTAGQGNSIGWRFEHLAEILSRTAKEERIGICLDTCHLFAAGYDLSTRAGYRKVFEEFERIVGLDRVLCFHLNDSKKPLGCRVDRHEEVGRGAIGLTAFSCLVNDPRFATTVGVLETPFQERYGEAIGLLESLVQDR